MQSPTVVCGVPFKQKPRAGQLRVFEKASAADALLTIQLPTGYGKTFAAMGVYSILKSQRKVDRCLYIVPRDAQKRQFCSDGTHDMRSSAIERPHGVCDIAYSGVASIREHREGKRQVFVVTIQALHAGSTVWDTVSELMANHKWLVVVDEHHHIGDEKPWGAALKKLTPEFVLAMSATPSRPGDDSPFKGDADVVVRYREAVEEKAVKEMRCHSYVYRVDAINEDGEIRSYTTTELAQEAGSDAPDAIERLRIERKMRWSPKYVSPLVAEPIVRMEQKRLETGHKLQVLVTAMCCSHAELVCEQLTTQHPHLRIDWVGTGEHGRAHEENEAALKAFCPEKVNGVRRREDIKLDVLVHVGLAGEGLDSINVCEIVHLHRANITNTNNQINGRGARYLNGAVCHVNVDSSSRYAEFLGEAIMDVMDCNDAAAVEVTEPIVPPSDWEPEERIPDEPEIQIYDLTLEDIETGGEYMKPFVIERSGYDPGDARVQRDAEKFYREMRRKECESLNDRSVVQQWSEQVENALQVLSGLILKLKLKGGTRFDPSIIGDIKTKLNARKKRACGAKENDVNVLRAHYRWLKGIERELVSSKELPSWL